MSKAGSAFVELKPDFGPLNEQLRRSVGPLAEKFGREFSQLTDKQLGQARSLRTMGTSYQEIAREIGVSERAAKSLTTGLDLQSRELGKLGSAGNAYREIGREMGLTDRQAKSLVGDLDRQDRAFTRTGAAAKRAEAGTSHLGAATGVLAGRFRGLIAAGAGVLAAYVGISQVTSAVNATEELAKATIALHRNLGLTIKAASEWAAVAAARGVDTKQLGMAFKTLATQISSAGHATTSTAANQKAIAAASQTLKTAVEGLTSAEAHATQAETDLSRARQAAAKTIRQDHITAYDALHSAQETVVQANQAERQSELSLIDVRRQAKQSILDLENAAIDAKLGHTGAVLGLQQAQQDLASAQSNPATTALQLAQAQLAVKQAQQAVKETAIGQTRAQNDANKAAKQGVDGNPAVVAAIQAVKQANQTAKDAVHKLAEAQKAYNAVQQETVAQSSSVISAQRQVASAQQAVAKAQEKVAQAEKKVHDARTAGSSSVSSTIKMLHELGFSHADIQKAMHNTQFALGKLSDGFKNLPAGVDKAAFAGKLFGRGWQTIFPLLRDGSGAMEQQLHLADKYGATFAGKPLNSINDLIQAQRELKLAQMGIQIQFTEHLAPALISGAKWFANLITQAGKGKGVFGAVAKGVGATAVAIGDAVKWSVQAGRDVGAFFNELGHTSDVKVAWQALKNLANFVADIFGPAIEKIGQVVKPVFEGLKNAFLGFAQIVRGVVQLVSGLLTGNWGKAWEGVKNIFGGGVRYVTGAMSAIYNVIKAQLEAGLAVVGAVAGKMWDAAKGLGDAIFGGLVKGITGLAAKVADFIWGAISAVVNAWVTAHVKAVEFGVRILKGVVDGITGLASKVADFVGAGVSAVANAVDRAGAAAFSFGAKILSGVGSGIAGLAGKVGSALSDGVQKIWDWAGGGAGNLVGAATAFASKIGDTIKSVLKTAVNAAIDMLNAIIDAWDSLKFKVPKINLPFGASLGGQTVSVPHIDKIPKLAEGIRDFIGGLAITGEAGAELQFLPSGADVFNAKETQRILRSLAAGSQPTHTDVPALAPAAADAQAGAAVATGPPTVYHEEITVMSPAGGIADPEIVASRIAMRRRQEGRR